MGEKLKNLYVCEIEGACEQERERKRGEKEKGRRKRGDGEKGSREKGSAEKERGKEREREKERSDRGRAGDTKTKSACD